MLIALGQGVFRRKKVKEKGTLGEKPASRKECFKTNGRVGRKKSLKWLQKWGSTSKKECGGICSRSAAPGVEEGRKSELGRIRWRRGPKKVGGEFEGAG